MWKTRIVWTVRVLKIDWSFLTQGWSRSIAWRGEDKVVNTWVGQSLDMIVYSQFLSIKSNIVGRDILNILRPGPKFA